MKTSLGLRCNKDYTKKNGHNALYLLVGVGNEWDKISLELDWPKALLNEKNNQLLPRTKPDPECNDYNLIIREAIAKANDIFITCRLQGKEITMQEFMEMYNNYLRMKDFAAYMFDKIKERYKRKKISESTKKSHVNTWIWLTMYKKEIKFQELTKKFIENFEHWMQKQNNRRSKEKKKLDGNTIANIMKYVKAYINLAIGDEIPIKNPFKNADVKTHQDVKIIEHLRPAEVADLMSYYQGDIPIGEKLSLCRLLIACHISLRISDILKINSHKLSDYKEARKLIFHPTKQVLTKKLKTVYVHIDDRAMQLLQDCVDLQNEAQAKSMKISESYGRKVLRKIGQKLHIDISGFHIGRHTFATTYIRAGGKVTNLQQIMGHSNINTTMRYVHIVEEDTEGDMVSLSNFYANAKKP